MANVSKLDNLSIDDLASLWGVDIADITKVMGLDVGVTGDLSAGPEEIFESGNTEHTSVITMDSTRAIVTYADKGHGDKGKAVCLTLSGNSITAGSSETFESGYARDTSVTTMDSSHAIVAYKDVDDSDKGKTVYLTLSETSITAEAPITFNSGGTYWMSITTIDENRAIVTYQDDSDGSKGKAACITLL